MVRATYGKSLALILPFLFFAFCTWGVYLGGLAAMQSICISKTQILENNPGVFPNTQLVNPAGGQNIYSQFSNEQLQYSGTAYLGFVDEFAATTLPCVRVYRWYWWIWAYELFLIVGLAVCVAAGFLYHTKLGWLGLYAVGFWLYIQAGDAFLNARDAVYYSGGGTAQSRASATAAGAIMTAVANAFMILALGIADALHHSDRHTVEKDTYAFPTQPYAAQPGGVVVQGAGAPVNTV